MGPLDCSVVVFAFVLTPCKKMLITIIQALIYYMPNTGLLLDVGDCLNLLLASPTCSTSVGPLCISLNGPIFDSN